MLIVARSFLRSRCDCVRPGRIVQHLQRFGLGPLVGRLVEEGFIRRKRNRQRHKCEDAKAVKSDLTQLGKERGWAHGGQLLTRMRFGAIIKDRPGPVNSQPFGTFGKNVLTNLLWLLYPESSVYCAWRVR